MNYLTLPIGPQAPEVVNAVIEVPQGQTNKYEYDKSLRVFRLDRPLYASVLYPGDYGFIPRTVSEDGDALDIIVLVTRPSFTGCLIETRPIGFLEMLDDGVTDRKVLAVASSSPTHKDIRDYTDLAGHVTVELEHFFSIYKELEGKHTEVQGWRGAQQARKLITASQQRYKKRRRRT